MVEIEVQNYAKEAGSVKYLPNSWNLVICPSFQVSGEADTLVSSLEPSGSLHEFLIFIQ